MVCMWVHTKQMKLGSKDGTYCCLQSPQVNVATLPLQSYKTLALHKASLLCTGFPVSRWTRSGILPTKQAASKTELMMHHKCVGHASQGDSATDWHAQAQDKWPMTQQLTQSTCAQGFHLLAAKDTFSDQDSLQSAINNAMASALDTRSTLIQATCRQKSLNLASPNHCF